MKRLHKNSNSDGSYSKKKFNDYISKSNTDLERFLNKFEGLIYIYKPLFLNNKYFLRIKKKLKIIVLHNLY